MGSPAASAEGAANVIQKPAASARIATPEIANVVDRGRVPMFFFIAISVRK
jgi:hypothetical protein